MLEERSIEFSASAKTKGTGKETNIGSRVDKGGQSWSTEMHFAGSPASGSETGFSHLRCLKRIRGMRVMYDWVCGLEEVKVLELAPRKEEERFDRPRCIYEPGQDG